LDKDILTMMMKFSIEVEKREEEAYILTTTMTSVSLAGRHIWSLNIA